MVVLQGLGHESEKYGGDILLSGQEALQEINRQVDGWTDCALKVFNRHRGDGGENHPDHDDMLKMNEVGKDGIINAPLLLHPAYVPEI